MSQGVGRRPDVAWVDSGDRIAVVRLHDLAAPPVILSGSAAEIWRALAAHDDTASIVGAVAEVYDCDPGLVAADIAIWLAEAQRLGIVAADDLTLWS